MTELKNCPHCGGEVFTDSINNTFRFMGMCVCTSYAENIKLATERWNQRTHTPEEASLIAIGRFSLESTYATLSEYYIADQYCTDDSIFLEAIREHQKEFGNG